jgi:hypothetical protein
MKTAPVLFAVIAALALLGCESTRGRISENGNLLSATGFSIRPADSPEGQRALRSLPANTFVSRWQGNQVTFLYADPVVCNCLYVGDQLAYNNYQHEMYERKLAEQQHLAVRMAMSTYNWEALY